MIGKLMKLVARNHELPDNATRPNAHWAPADARTAFFQIVDERATRKGVPFHTAMAEVKVERPDLLAAAYPQRRRETQAIERELLAA